jgi:hypothetical protein
METLKGVQGELPGNEMNIREMRKTVSGYS